jgi:hypothetical protein
MVAASDSDEKDLRPENADLNRGDICNLRMVLGSTSGQTGEEHNVALRWGVVSASRYATDGR